MAQIGIDKSKSFSKRSRKLILRSLQNGDLFAPEWRSRLVSLERKKLSSSQKSFRNGLLSSSLFFLVVAQNDDFMSRLESTWLAKRSCMSEQCRCSQTAAWAVLSTLSSFVVDSPCLRLLDTSILLT